MQFSSCFSILKNVPYDENDRLIGGNFTCSNGLMKATIHIKPASANNFATSAIRRIFSTRSASENPKFLFKPHRILSPSRQYAGKPLLTMYSSNAKLNPRNRIYSWKNLNYVAYAIVDFPAPESPKLSHKID